MEVSVELKLVQKQGMALYWDVTLLETKFIETGEDTFPMILPLIIVFVLS